MKPTARDHRSIARLIGTALVTFTVLLHITFPNLGVTGITLPFNSAVWMGVATMTAVAIWPTTRGTLYVSAFHKALVVLLLALWLPLLWSWSETSPLAVPRLLGVTAGALLLVGLAQLAPSRRHWWWLGMAILLGALLESALGYIQLYAIETGDWLSLWLGYDPRSGRPVGIFQQPNVMASFLVTGLAISAWLFGEAHHRLARGVTLLAPLLMPAIILMTQSRTGWLASLIVTPLLLLHLGFLDQRRLTAWAGALTVGCLIATLAWWAPWAEQATAIKEVAKAGQRLPVYLHSLGMIAEQPFSGWGYGGFQHDFLHSFADWRATLPVNQPRIVEPIITSTFTHPHNELLLWGVEGGLLPPLAIAAFTAWVLWRLWAHGPERQRLLFTALLLPMGLHAMTEFPFYYSTAHWLTFVLLLGLLADRCWQTKPVTLRRPGLLRVSIAVLLPAALLFMATNLYTLWQIKYIIVSDGKDVGSLERIINPLGIRGDIEYLEMNHDLYRKDAQAYREYVEWWRRTARTLPNQGLYENMLVLERLQGRKDETLTHEEAVRLYPLIRQWLPR